MKKINFLADKACVRDKTFILTRNMFLNDKNLFTMISNITTKENINKKDYFFSLLEDLTSSIKTIHTVKSGRVVMTVGPQRPRSQIYQLLKFLVTYDKKRNFVEVVQSELQLLQEDSSLSSIKTSIKSYHESLLAARLNYKSKGYRRYIKPKIRVFPAHIRSLRRPKIKKYVRKMFLDQKTIFLRRLRPEEDE